MDTTDTLHHMHINLFVYNIYSYIMRTSNIPQRNSEKKILYTTHLFLEFVADKKWHIPLLGLVGGGLLMLCVLSTSSLTKPTHFPVYTSLNLEFSFS